MRLEFNRRVVLRAAGSFAALGVNFPLQMSVAYAVDPTTIIALLAEAIKASNNESKTQSRHDEIMESLKSIDSKLSQINEKLDAIIDTLAKFPGAMVIIVDAGFRKSWQLVVAAYRAELNARIADFPDITGIPDKDREKLGELGYKIIHDISVLCGYGPVAYPIVAHGYVTASTCMRYAGKRAGLGQFKANHVFPYFSSTVSFFRGSHATLSGQLETELDNLFRLSHGFDPTMSTALCFSEGLGTPGFRRRCANVYFDLRPSPNMPRAEIGNEPFVLRKWESLLTANDGADEPSNPRGWQNSGWIPKHNNSDFTLDDFLVHRRDALNRSLDGKVGPWRAELSAFKEHGDGAELLARVLLDARP